MSSPRHCESAPTAESEAFTEQLVKGVQETLALAHGIRQRLSVEEWVDHTPGYYNFMGKLRGYQTCAIERDGTKTYNAVFARDWSEIGPQPNGLVLVTKGHQFGEGKISRFERRQDPVKPITHTADKVMPTTGDMAFVPEELDLAEWRRTAASTFEVCKFAIELELDSQS